MDIKNTAIWPDIKAIIDSGQKPVHHSWVCDLLLPEQTIRPFKLVSIEIVRDYEHSFSDKILIEIILPRSSYVNILYPNRDQLTVTLQRTAQGERIEGNTVSIPLVRSYKGVLTDRISDEILSLKSNSEVLERDLQTYYIQLIDKAAEVLLMKQVGGIYKDCVNHELIQGVLTVVSGELELDETSSIYGVDVVEGDNLEIRSHTIVPQGTKVVDMPDYIQNYAGGVYATKLGYYLQTGIWYVYPQYSFERYTREPKNVTVINVPDNKLPSIERSYFFDDIRLLLLATGVTKHIDNTEKEQIEFGNAVRYLDASKVMGEFRIANENKGQMIRSENVVEMQLGTRRNSLNQAPMSPRRITANHYRESSEVSIRMGMYIKVTWQNADSELIYPGQPVKYVYMKDGLLNEIYGCILGMECMITTVTAGMNTQKYKSDVILTLFVYTENPTSYRDSF